MTTQAAVGIDLGVRQASIAVMVKNEPKIIPATDGSQKTPTFISYSYISPNTFKNLVGPDAVNATLKGQQSVYDPKRILGRNFSDPEVQTFVQKVPFQVINENGGDRSIGGQTFTENITQFVTDSYQKSEGGEDYNPNYIEELRLTCELKKKELFSSRCESVYIKNAGYWRSTQMTETIFDKINVEVFTNIQKTLANFLLSSVSGSDEIGQVILVGGSTRIPKIENIIRSLLPKANIRKTIDVETIVAVGATIHANSKTRFTENAEKNSLQSLVPVKVIGICTPAAIGVHFTYDWQIKENNNSDFGIVIPKGTELPCFAEKQFWFPPQQGRVIIRIFEGDHNHAEHNDELGRCEVDGIKLSKIFCRLKIQMYLSATGELKVRAAYDGTLQIIYNWKFVTLNILEVRKSNHYYVHRPDKQSSDYSSFAATSRLLSGQPPKAQADLGKLYYQQKMDSLVSSLEFVPEESFKEAHDKSVEDAVEELSKAYPLTPELIQSTRKHLDSVFYKYSELNNRKKDIESRVAIGIDFGTAFSSVAFVSKDGTVEMIPDLVGKLSTPSCITFEDDDVTFGTAAQGKAVENPENCVFDIKRMLGRHILDPQVAQLRKFWPFKTLGEDGSICVEILGKKYQPQQLVTLYVKHLIENATTFLNQDVIHAVVAIPAYFTPRQRHLTKEAFNDAGINVLQLLNEPTAASLAYNEFVTVGPTKHCLVFDLGGGTFDLAILETNGSTHMKIKAIDGDPFLGGADFDNDLMKYCIEEFEIKNNIPFQDVGSHATKLRRLKKQCESVKENLSAAKKVTVTLDAIHNDLDLVVRVDRSKFELLIEEKLNKCMAIVDRLVESVDISEVVLVGGSSRIPRVQSLLKERFGDKVPISKRMSPVEAVARGAALLAARIQNNDTSFCIEELDKKIIV
ncbi:unnamed protein product [Allacma fusca]|uniref:Heat shock protein 70 n=1 Tax=Allacma fusca TaxID=39272 RepID=A0A8J2PG68_9HEXA|nr:unnamed protein product [Allacma fusca]